MEEYAKQRAEEQAILRVAQQMREEKNKEALKLTAEEVVKIQGRVSIIPVVGPDITGHVMNFANNVIFRLYKIISCSFRSCQH